MTERRPYKSLIIQMEAHENFKWLLIYQETAPRPAQPAAEIPNPGSTKTHCKGLVEINTEIFGGANAPLVWIVVRIRRPQYSSERVRALLLPNSSFDSIFAIRAMKCRKGNCAERAPWMCVCWTARQTADDTNDTLTILTTRDLSSARSGQTNN